MIFQVQGFRRAFLLVAGLAVAAPLAAQEAPVPAGSVEVASPMSSEARRERERLYTQARAAAEARPDDPEALLWYGRRAAWLGNVEEAVDIFSRGLARFPDDPRLLRHRGHRYITLRRFDLAVADLERAARLAAERMDQPEPGETPSRVQGDTLRSNISYHLGIAHYLAGDFEAALRAQEDCLRLPATPDREAGARFWSYLALRRLGRGVEARQKLAPVRPNMAVVESRAYLLLMMMFKGDLTPDSLLAPGVAGEDPVDPAILRYGVGTWFLVEGKRNEALQAYREAVSLGQRHSFAHIAAEADLQRLGEKPAPAAPQRGR